MIPPIWHSGKSKTIEGVKRSIPVHRPLSWALGEFFTHLGLHNKEHNSGRKSQVTTSISVGKLQICSLVNSFWQSLSNKTMFIHLFVTLLVYCPRSSWFSQFQSLKDLILSWWVKNPHPNGSFLQLPLPQANNPLASSSITPRWVFSGTSWWPTTFA